MGIKYILCKCVLNVFIVYTLWVLMVYLNYSLNITNIQCDSFYVFMLYICHELPPKDTF